MPRSVPQVAQCEDYDDETKATKPGTRREARRRTTSSSRPPKSIDRYRSTPRDIASDSGYSSHTSGTQASNISAVAPPAPTVEAPPTRPAAAQAAPKAKPKPILHRSESQRSRDKGSSRSSSRSTRREACRDLNCQHAECYSARTMERRHSASQQNTASQPMAPPQQVHQQQQPRPYRYSYASVPQTPSYQTATPLVTAPRPRPQSVRPTSVHGYPVSSATNHSSMTPSYAAYQDPHALAWLQYNQQQQQQQWLRWQQAQAEAQQRAQAQQQAQAQAYRHSVNYSATPLTASQANYPYRSPVTASPTSPDFGNAPTFQATYAYRHAVPPNEAALQQSRPGGALRTYSARQASLRQQAMPGTYPRDDIESSESCTDSSPSDDSEEERDRHYRPRARDSRLMSSSSGRRPSIKRTYATAPVVPTRTTREHLLRRNHQSDTGLEHISSEDNMDSDRTARAVIEQPRRSHTNSSRGSRRPSVSTTASSGRTKATTVSSTSGLANVIVERNGRRITYLSQRDRDRYENEHRREHDTDYRYKLDELQEKVRAYQHDVQAGAAVHLTAQDIIDHECAKQEKQRQSQGGSNFSSHSRQDSHTSASSRNADSEIKIVHGGSVLHLPSNTPIEMRQHDDGSSTLIIGSSSRDSRRDSKYYATSSKHSNRRMSQTYGAGGNEADSRYEETILEDEGQDGGRL